MHRLLLTSLALLPLAALGDVLGADPGVVLSAPLNTSGNWPPCTDDPYDASAPLDERITQACVMDCGVGVYDGTLEWQCVTGAGVQVPVQNASACGTAQSVLVDADGTRKTVLGRVTDACAPYVRNSDLPQGFPTVLDDFTAISYQQGAIGVHVFLGHGFFLSDGFYLQGASIQLNGDGVRDYATCGNNQNYGVGFLAGGRSGSNVFAFCPGSYVSMAPTTSHVATTRNLYFGRYEGAGYSTGLHYYRARFYSRGLTQQEIERLYAIVSGAGPHVTVSRSTIAFGEVGGQWYAFVKDAPVITDKGVSVWQAVTNEWANSLDASAWTQVGTPSVTVDTDSGPFSDYNGGAEADTVTDDDAAAKECLEAQIGTAAGDYTVSMFLAAGTSTDYTLEIVTDGTGSTSCTGTDLTSSFTRKTCTATVGGTPTYVKGRICVGDVAGDTGSIKVSGAQGESGSVAGRPCVAGASVATCAADVVKFSAAHMPSGSGELCVDAVIDASASGSQTLLDSVNSGDGIRLYQDTGGNLLKGEQHEIGAGVVTASSSLAWTTGSRKRICARYGPSAIVLHADGAHIVSASATAPPQHSSAGKVYLGSVGGSSLFLDGSLRSLEVRR